MAVNRKIVGFHKDEAGDWVAELACGHGYHMRHNPPYQDRAWVLMAEGRAEHIGIEVDCRKCDVNADSEKGSR